MATTWLHRVEQIATFDRHK